MYLFGSVASTFGLFLLSPNDGGHQRRGGGSGTTFSASTAATTHISAIDATQVATGKKYEAMLDWLLTSKDAEVSEKIELRPSTRGGGYGAFVTRPVDANELLFTIPRAACVTFSDALSDSSCGELFKTLIEKAGPGGNTVAMAGFIAKERLKSLKPDEDDSAYGPYLATLPWERGVNNQEHILYWSDDEIESLLTGTMSYGEAVDLRREVAVAIKVLDTIIGRPVSTFLFPWQKDDSPRMPVEGLPEAVRAAFVCLLTRAFQDDDDGDEEKLVPLLDMLQHSDQPNVSHQMRKDDGTVEVRARRSLEPGDELLNQYRSEMEESMPYHRFFTRFGFVPGIQEPIENLLLQKSSIFFAQQAEV